MPKIDLTNVLEIKISEGEVLELKGQGFSWEKYLPPSVTIPVPNGNLLSTTASITPEGVVTIVNTNSSLSGDLGVIHYLVKTNNVKGLNVVAKRSTNDPTATDGNDLTQWQMAWAYDVDGDWFPFDNYVNLGGYINASNNQPSSERTMFIARRPIFSTGRWNRTINEWISNPLTSPTPSGDTDYVVGVLPTNAYSPSLPIYGMKFGEGSNIVVITGIIHVDEHIASYAMVALVNWLLGSDPNAVFLRDRCTFYIYPNMNPQSLYAGASRNEITTGNNANRIFLDEAEFDSVPLSKVWRDVWKNDLPSKISGNIDFHDAARSPGRGMLYNAGAGLVVGPLRAEYFTRTGVDIEVGSGAVLGGVARYIRNTFLTDWTITAEHYLSRIDGIPQWEQWGRDYGTAMRSYYDLGNTAKWLTPPWELWSTANGAYINYNDGNLTTGREANTPGLSIPIPEGKTIEVIFDTTSRVNISQFSIRHGLGTSLSGFTELASSSGSGNYRRVQRATWSSTRTHIGILGLANKGSNPSSFSMSNMVRYRIL